jgi:hypothetical protein
MKIKLVSLFSCLLLLAGCAGYKSQPLNLLHNPATYQKNRSVLIDARALTESDCKIYLGRNVIAAGYRPIYISIKNDSESYLKFFRDNINVRTVPADLVAKKVHHSIWSRALGYGIPGMLLMFPLLIPAVVDSCWAHEANEQLTTDYIEKSIRDRTICPQGRHEGLIFVPLNDYNDCLKVTLINSDTQEKIVCEAELS